MATFIQGVTDTNLDPVLFTPDYSFLRYNLQKKSAQYDQGLKSVASAYGAMKKELSDPTNVQRRDQYLKNAESELQKISSADLSLQQNVNAANAIFDPIATDPAIAYDSFHTGRIKRELSTMETWASSDDMETRKKYNQDIYSWLKRDLDSLKNGNGDVNSYRVQGRKAWAYADPQDIINKAAKDQGFVIKNDATGNPYIVTTEGGPANREAYEKFAKSVLRSNPIYQQQKQIMGEARQESDLDYIMRNPAYAGMSREEGYKKLATDKYTEGRNTEKEYITGLSDNLSTRTSEYMAYLNKNGAAINSNPQSPEAQTARKMGADLVQYKTDVDQASADYVGKYGPDDASFEQKRKTFTEGFLKNPKGYYSNQYDVENMIMFSNIRSSFGTRTIKADQGYLGVLAATNRSLTTLNNIVDDKFDNDMDIEELKLKELNLKTKMLGKDKTGQRLKNADGTDKQSDVEYIGTSATQVTTVQKINQLREKLELNKTNAVSALTSTYGGLYLLEKMGSKQQDVSLVRGFLSRKAADDNVKPSGEETAALKSVYQNMWSWAKQNPEMNQDMLGGLRTNYNKAYKDMDFPGLLRLATKNYVTTDNNDYQAKLNLAKHDDYMQETQRISGLLNKSVEAVVKQVKGDPSYRNVLVEENGTTRLLQADDVFKKLPASGWREDIDWAIDPSVKLSEQDRRNIAEGIFDGRVKVDVGSYVKGGGRAGTDAGFRYRTSITYQGRTFDIETPESISPSSDELNSKLKAINERMPIPVLESEVPGVMVAGSSGFIIRNQSRDDIRVKLAAGATQENSNIVMADGTGTATGYTDVQAPLQDEVRKALANKDNVEQMTIWTNSPLNSGSQVVEVVMASKGGEKGPFWSGQRFFFPVNVNKTSNEVFSVFSQADELDEYMSYSKRNEPYKIDYFEGSGVKAEVVADQPGSKTGRVLLQQKTYDPTTGRYVDNWSTKEVTFDLNKLTFAEMKEEIFNNFITPYMQGYMNHNKQAAAAVGASGGNLVQQYKNLVTW